MSAAHLYRILETTVTLVLPLIVLPFFMRFLVSRIVLFVVKRRHLPEFIRLYREGWQEEEDEEVTRAVADFALRRLKAGFVMRYRWKEDLEELLLLIQGIYHPRDKDKSRDESGKFSYSFSLTKLSECLLLAFGDFYREYASDTWFRMIQNTRLLWFSRAMTLHGYYNGIFKRVPILARLRSLRLIGKIFRILLIPILGVPSLIWFAIRSVLLSVFSEGYLRFLYGVVMLKIGYYGMYLYGRKNSSISRRIKEISKDRLWIINIRTEELLSFSSREEVSPLYKKAVATYLELLREFGLETDGELDPTPVDRDSAGTGKGRGKGEGILKKLIETSKAAYKRQNPLSSKAPSDIEQLKEMIERISQVYNPDVKQPYLRLRVRELLEGGYLASVLFLYRIFSTPGARGLLDKISLEFALQVRQLSADGLVRGTARGMNLAYRYFRVFRNAQRVFRLFAGVGGPATLIASLGSPILVQQLRSMIMDYVYHRAGRLTIHVWETNKLGIKRKLDLLLW